MSAKLDFPVVGIGASAGGLQALLRFFENLPAHNGMAFVVILHLSPKYESNADSVLQGVTKMPVVQVTRTLQIEKNHVYVISPKTQLTMNDGFLSVADVDQRPRGAHVAIDLFFRTLADTHRERAIGIVLSGTGSDGAVGLARLKEQGGVAMVQDPNDAEHDGMPLAAIGTGTVDFILPVVDMPQKLIDISNNARNLRLPPANDPDAPLAATVAATSDDESERALHDVIRMLHIHTGHDFRHYKRATVLRRIERRMQVRGVSNLPDYRALLERDEQENPALLSDMLIGVTNFFRDREAFDALEREILPQLFQGKQPDEQVRAWVAACSTGEEAYSIAMLLADQAALLPKPPRIQVFASDIDERAISVARAGIYPSSIVTDVPAIRLRQFFAKEEDRYRVRKIVRDSILFAAHNLLHDPPFSKLDLISCRNLLIYLNRDVQAQVLELFHFALNPGGFLFLGSAESADAASNFFTPIDKKNRIYRARTLSRTARYTPLLPFGPTPKMAVHDVAAQPNRRKFSFGEMHQRVLAQYAPPSLIVNQESNIVHMSDRAGRFLRHVGGEPSRNVVSLVYPELRVELRTALFQAWQSGKSVEARRVRLTRDERMYYVNMIVRPFHDEDAGADFMLIMFDEVEQTMSEEAPAGEGDKKDMVLKQLEDELQRTKEQLQETVEQSEISTEELRASNEEQQAINEELRSATEELETSKEELQSVNEELVTVNYELRLKVEETGKINDDLNNLVASTDIATVFVDSGMRIKRYTPRATDIFSVIPSDIGRSLLDITHRLDYDQLSDDAAATFETLRLVEREVRSTDGRFYIARMLPYRTTEDKIDGAVLTFFDITDRRLVEEKLRAGEARMRLAAESTKDYAIITMDTDTCVTSWNKGAERMFGYTEEEMLGQSGDRIFTLEDRENGIADDERRRARQDGRAEDERWHLRKDGSKVFCSGVLTPLRNGEFYGYAKIARDQTERKFQESRRDAQLSEAQARRGEAQLANALKDEFLAIMSHELRHPLNLIYINAELLSRLPEVAKSPVTAHAAGVIRNAVVSQAKIIDDLLDLSRANTGKLRLDFADVDLCGVARSIAEVMQADPAAAELKISLRCISESTVIRADRVRIEQIVVNLLSNAIKFTPAGGRIDLRVEREGGSARLDVVDTGHGIAAEFLPHVFDTFSTAGTGMRRSKDGLGIGLMLVRHIVELHGGTIEVASEGLGRGTRFTVRLPFREAAPNRQEQQSQTAPAGIAGKAILLVDDMKDVVDSLKVLLEIEGLTVYAATEAQEALKILDEHPVDVLVSDIAMPGMDGHALIREVRKKPGLEKLPAIAVTGFGRLEDAEHAREAGFSAHISKPVLIDTLINTAADLLRK
ncbi:PAS domain S-box protein [Herbaspirillum sp. HC18]|nr:PAS domain S-box protein [Herbaspirillum sp. HC18]